MQIQQKLTSIMELHSPSRRQSSQANQKSMVTTALTLHQTPHKMSQTQKQIFSHCVVKQIVQKSKQKTIQHHVNTIPAHCQLYNIPLDPITDQLVNIANTIPPTKENFFSTESVKIQQINERLKDNRDIAEKMNERLQQIAQKNKSICEEKRRRRPQSAREPNVDRRVSVSGLVSYNFNSVKARRQLSSIPDIPQQQALENEKQRIRQRNTCSQSRRQSIIHRKPNPQSLHWLETQKAIATNFSTPTDTFLKHLIKQSREGRQYYGQKYEKLKCIKQYMEGERVDYQHAEHVVNIIVNSNRKEKKKPEKAEVKKIDDEILLAKRRCSVQSRRVIIKNLYFVE